MNARQPAAPPDPILDRFWKLVRLATNNPSAEEARTAAMKAVQFLVEHKLSVVLPHAPVPPVAAPIYQDFSDLMRAHEQAQARWPGAARMRKRWQYDPKTDSYVDPETQEPRSRWNPFR